MAKILVIAAHMDDEVLGCGGTILKYKDAGYEVFVLYVCSRAYNNAIEEVTVKREEECAAKACAVLGVDDFWFLKLRDEQLDHRVIDAVVPIENKIVALQPEIVFTNHRGDNNQDHKAVFNATMIASRAFADWQLRKLYCYEVLSSTEQSPQFSEYSFQPNLFFNIEPYFKKKLDAFNCYRYEQHKFPHPRSPEAITALAQYRGTAANLKYAEAFVVAKEIQY